MVALIRSFGPDESALTTLSNFRIPVFHLLYSWEKSAEPSII